MVGCRRELTGFCVDGTFQGASLLHRTKICCLLGSF